MISISKVEGGVDYDKLYKEFGVSPIQNYLKKMKKLDMIYRRGYVFAQRDFGKIFDAIQKKKRFAVLTGVNPDAPMHFGNKMFLDQALFFQKMGAEVFIPISNDESYFFGKVDTLEKATDIAFNSIIPDIIALGFKPGKTKIFVSSKTVDVYELAVTLSRKTTFSVIKAIFGFTNETNPGAIFYGVVQSAHILLPQLKKFGGPRPVVVPMGIDQDPYLRLSRDLADKVGFVKPSSTYHKFMLGLRGGKMSKSKPESCIFLTDKPKEAAKKLMSAITGGRKTVEEQKRMGGEPDKCSVYEYFALHLVEDDKKLEKIRQECLTGKRLCGDCKKECAELLKKFLKEHQRKRTKARKKINKFLLKD